MAATNGVAERTGNVSAGTSIFSMVVLEKPLRKVHREIDMVTTPAGRPVAMVHCNNCTSDLNAWVGLLAEFARELGADIDKNALYGMLFRKALEADADCGGLIAYNYLSGEHITGMEEGRPLFARLPDAELTLANFMRVHPVYSALATLKLAWIFWPKKMCGLIRFLAMAVCSKRRWWRRDCWLPQLARQSLCWIRREKAARGALLCWPRMLLTVRKAKAWKRIWNRRCSLARRARR